MNRITDRIMFIEIRNFARRTMDEGKREVLSISSVRYRKDKKNASQSTVAS